MRFFYRGILYIALSFLVTSSTLHAQVLLPDDYANERGLEYSDDQLQNKYRAYGTLRNIGLITVVVSAAVIGSGIYLNVNRPEFLTTDEKKQARRINPDTTFRSYNAITELYSFLSFAIGIPLSGAGTTVTIFGWMKRYEYLKKLRIRGLKAGGSMSGASFSLIVDY